MSLIGVRQNPVVRFQSINLSPVSYDFELDELRIYEEHEQYVYTLADDSTEHFMGRFFLHYDLRFRKMKRVGTVSGRDLSDLLNAFRNPAETVRIYPAYEIDSTLFYTVRLHQGRTDLLTFERGLQRFPRQLRVVNTQGLDTIPAALRSLPNTSLSNIQGTP